MPFLPFALLAACAGAVAYIVPRQWAQARAVADEEAQERERLASEEARQSIKVELKLSEIEIVLGQQLSSVFMRKQEELFQRVGKLRRKFAREYGFVVPEIQLSDDFSLSPRGYEIRLHGAAVANHELPIGEVLVVIGDGRYGGCGPVSVIGVSRLADELSAFMFRGRN